MKKYLLELNLEELEMLHDNVYMGYEHKREVLLKKINKLLPKKDER
jgi:hypothetical protein